MGGMTDRVAGGPQPCCVPQLSCLAGDTPLRCPPARIAAPPAFSSSWAETRPPRLIRPVHVSTRPVCRVLAPANESDYVVLPHLPESPGSFPRTREPRRVIVKGPRGDLGY